MKVNLCLLISASLMIGCSANKSVTLHNQKNDIQATSKQALISAKTVDEYLHIAKTYENKKNYEMAVFTYQKALLLEPNNTKALTGLASGYASQNLYSVAIPLLEKVVALDASAKHYSNLGYAYYLNQQYDESKRVLNQAILIDPNYQQAKNNLELVDANYTAEQTVKTLAHKEKTVEYVVVNKQANVISDGLAPEKITSITGLEVISTSNTALEAASNGVYELNFPAQIDNQSMPAKVATQQLSEKSTLNDVEKSHSMIATISGGITFKHMPVVSKLFDLATTGIISLQLTPNHEYMEIINGNGIKGIARTVAAQLKDRGVEHVKVADAKRFNLAKTHIQYRTGYREDAVSLNHNLLNRPFLLRNDNLPADIKIRLVLGRDLMANMNQAELGLINVTDSDS